MWSYIKDNSLYFFYIGLMALLLLVYIVNRLVAPLPDWLIGTVGVIMMVDMMLIVFSTVRIILKRNSSSER